MDGLRNLEVCRAVVGGKGGQGAPTMAASGRLAFEPTAKAGPKLDPLSTSAIAALSSRLTGEDR